MSTRKDNTQTAQNGTTVVAQANIEGHDVQALSNGTYTVDGVNQGHYSTSEVAGWESYVINGATYWVNPNE